MTTEQYKKAIEDAEREITRLVKVRDEYTIKAASENQQAIEWRDWAQKTFCNQALKKNRDKCFSDKEYRFNRFNLHKKNEASYLKTVNEQITNIATQNALIEEYKLQLGSSQVSHNEVSKILANKGFTRETLMVNQKNEDAVEALVAQSQIDAQNKVAEVQIQALKTDLETESSNKKRKALIITAVAVLVVIVVAVIIYKKYKK